MTNNYSQKQLQQLHLNGSLLLVCPKGHTSIYSESAINKYRCDHDGCDLTTTIDEAKMLACKTAWAAVPWPKRVAVRIGLVILGIGMWILCAALWIVGMVVGSVIGTFALAIFGLILYVILYVLGGAASYPMWK